MPKVEISVKTVSGQTIVLSQGDRLVKEVTIECNSGRCASRHGQDKPTEVVIVDEKLPEAGEQWLSLILPEGSPQFEAMPKNFCGPQCVRDFLVYDYIAPGPRTVSEPTPEQLAGLNSNVFAGNPPTQPVAPNCPLDEHHHKPGEFCRGCAELTGNPPAPTPVPVPIEEAIINAQADNRLAGLPPVNESISQADGCADPADVHGA